jgi:hypothetical protein
METLNARITSLLKSSESQLYEEVGLALTGAAALPTSRQELIESGKRWFASRQHELAQLVCKNDRLKSVARQDLQTHELVVATCGSLDLAIHLLGGIPAVTVAALIVRLGLHEFCRAEWHAQS